MGRQTAFPGVIVKSIHAKSGGSGRELTFEEGLPEDIPQDRIESFLDQLPLFGDELVDSSIEYNLLVAAPHEIVAKTKARAFVRVKNPFESSMVSVSDPQERGSVGVLDQGRQAYDVSVKVSK